MNGPEDCVAVPLDERCTVVYEGGFWPHTRCREIADHSHLSHVDRYAWSGRDYEDAHEPHDHHVDGFGRTWRDVP